MIPRIIHYCWFGDAPKPNLIERCISSWRKHLPEYKTIEWNEKNFDIHCCPFVEEAFESRKYAFVSDVVRGHALYSHGGIYLDADVEVLKSFDPFLSHRSFWGFEAENFVATSTIGAVKGHEIIKAYLDHYNNRHFKQPDGSFDIIPNVTVVTRLLQERGLTLDNTKQEIGDGNIIYPQKIFSPYDPRTGSISRGSETIAIHHYSNTWDLSALFLIKRTLKKTMAKLIGKKLSEALWLEENDRR